MKYLELTAKIKQNIFTLLDVIKTFPGEKEATVKVQLHRFAKKGQTVQIKRGLYCFNSSTVDELELAGVLYQPSYVSMETALNYYGLIPDIPLAVSSVTLTTTKHLKNSFGNFDYYKTKPSLFFGFTPIETPNNGVINMADKEKALLDYLYLRKMKGLADSRLNTKILDLKKYKKYALSYPRRIQKIKIP